MNVVLLRSADNDQLEIDLELRPDGVVMPRISVVAGLMAVRGRGIVRFNDTIDLVLNGGPMERLQESIGAIGRALGSLTDRIVRYQVTGSTENPIIRVRPFGLFTGDPMAEAKAQREEDRARYQAERQKRQEAEQAQQEGTAEQGTPPTGTETPAPNSAGSSGSGS